ncbi:MAG: hypothetical protein JWL66_2686 [Sphingomonadales bacterium]|nr:hypothetical protein [Sphingomonadales bacterium]
MKDADNRHSLSVKIIKHTMAAIDQFAEFRFHAFEHRPGFWILNKPQQRDIKAIDIILSDFAPKTPDAKRIDVGDIETGLSPYFNLNYSWRDIESPRRE